MPYRTYQADPTWAAVGGNLANALFPDPARQAAIQGQLLQNRGLEQQIALDHRTGMLGDQFMDAIRGGNFPEQHALAGGLGPQHMNAMGNFQLAQLGAPGSVATDADLHRGLVGAGKMPGTDTSVSPGRQDAVSARNAAEAFEQAMSVEGMRQAGQDRRHEPESTAWQRNKLFEAQTLHQVHGLPWDEALSTAFGHRNDRMDDLGNLSVVDIAHPGGRAARIPVSGMEPEPLSVPPVPGREDLAFNPGEGTGAWASAQGAWNRTVGQVVPSLTAMGPEQAAQQTNVMRLNIMSALRSTNRPLSIEMNLVNSLLPDTMSFLQSPEVAQEQTLQVLDLVGQQYLADMQAAQDPTLPQRERGEHRQRATQLLRGLQIGLNPEAVDRYTGAAGAPPTPRRTGEQRMPGRGMQEMMQGPAGGGQVPDIVPPDRQELFQAMTPEEQQEYLELLQMQGGM